MSDAEFPAISDYAYIGDCHSCALIGRDASVEWACFHRFDSRPPFARILDRDCGGYFRIAPAGEWEGSHRYLPETNVLETRFETPSGAVTVTDCMPLRGDPDEPGRTHRPDPSHLLIRVVRGLAGSVELELAFKPRFEYGMTTPLIEQRADDLVQATGGPEALVLQSGLRPLVRDEHGGCDARATVDAGEVRVVALMEFVSHAFRVERLDPDDLLARVEETVRFWESWSTLSGYEGPYRDAVARSALAIKALTDAHTGSIVAAPTTSLPEEIGGVRNWDYRYVWIRDSATLLGALARLGHRFEVQEFASWIRRTVAGRPSQLQIMYGLEGERILTETELPHLSGYRNSRPVRIGNAAWGQLQVDIYGALNSISWLLAHQFAAENPDGPLDSLDPVRARAIADVVDEAIAKFELPDEGIWEVRGESRHFLFSKLMAWVAVDRGIGVAELAPEHFADELPRWRRARDEMRERIEREGVHPETGAFTQAFESTASDAAALHVGLQGFLPFDDPRVLATIEAVDRDLGAGGHIYRYRADDGLPGEEGAFTFCTLWMARCLAHSGEVERARERLELVLSHASDLGLLAEQIDPATGQQLGNYPQAFSHVGVINTALAIAAAEEGDRSLPAGEEPAEGDG